MLLLINSQSESLSRLLKESKTTDDAKLWHKCCIFAASGLESLFELQGSPSWIQHLGKSVRNILVVEPWGHLLRRLPLAAPPQSLSRANRFPRHRDNRHVRKRLRRLVRGQLPILLRGR
ncbi:MAG: hypothetical protein ACKO2P_13450 [Planctomycetota bacterium]